MESRVNRAEVLLDNWRELETKLAGFGEANGSTSREMIFQHYDFLRVGVWKLSLDPGPHEKANLALLKGSLTRMEKQLLPGVVTRLLVKLKAALFERPRLIKEFKEMKGLNERELKRFLNEEGFSPLVPRLASELDYERPWFGMKMSGQLEEGRRIELELQVVKMLDGKYYPSLIEATLVEADGQKMSHDFLLSDYMLDAAMVTNLMQGRAVSVLDREGRGKGSEVWLQVHFGTGDSYLRNFKADYGFDASKLLADFALQIGKVELDDERLLGELKKGNQVSFPASAPFNRTLTIEADPAAKQLTVRGDAGDVISMQQLIEQKQQYVSEMGKGIRPESNLTVQHHKSNGLENRLGI